MGFDIQESVAILVNVPPRALSQRNSYLQLMWKRQGEFPSIGSTLKESLKEVDGLKF